MTNRIKGTGRQLAALASHLAGRREKILDKWREAVRVAPELETASNLSHAEFNDHIPEVLDAFERKLCAQGHAEESAAAADQDDNAAGHGIHRWRLGYSQRDIMRDWSQLHLCLVDELENYATAHPELEPDVMPTARRALADLINEGVTESAGQYAELQRLEATGRVHALEQAIAEEKKLDCSRVDLLRDATHDLRGELGVIQVAAAALSYEDISEQERTELLNTIHGGVEGVRTLLNDLLSLARLSAGQERPEIGPVDVAVLLRDLCVNLKVIAAKRGLGFEIEGPSALSIEGDAVMIQRIAQNLLLNALNYTECGEVKVTWDADEGWQCWVLCIQDTGPGFQSGPGTPLALALKDATDTAQGVEEKAKESEVPSARTEPAPMLASETFGSSHQAAGEGIGLSIVKRLCELLDARLELQTEYGKGSTFRVTFPRSYSPPSR